MNNQSNNSLPSTLKRARFSRIGVVFVKEMRENLRDYRVILGVIVSPLLMTPLILAVIGYFINQKQAEVKAETLPVAVVGSDRLPELAALLKSESTLTTVELATVADGEKQVKDRKLRVVLVVPPDAKTTMAADKTVTVELLFDSANEKSRTAKSRIEELLKGFNQNIIEARLKTRNLDPQFTKPTEMKSRSVASENQIGGLILSILLPYTIIVSTAFGGMTSAFEICAGEKEHGTMETLLVSPASRTEIILGKLLTIGGVSVISAFFSIVGLVVSFQSGLKMFDSFTRGKIAISYPSVAAMFVFVIPVAMMTSAVLLIISSFARNQKEAQAYVFPFVMVVLVPAMLSFVLGEESSLGLSVVPILNTALAIKQILLNIVNVKFIALMFISSAAYAGAALLIVVALFNREEILFRS